MQLNVLDEAVTVIEAVWMGDAALLLVSLGAADVEVDAVLDV